MFQDYVAPICLPKTKEQMANVLIGEKMTVAGWGKTNMTTEERGQILQVVSVSTLPSKKGPFHEIVCNSSSSSCNSV